jgi:hypothetical protein
MRKVSVLLTAVLAAAGAFTTPVRAQDKAAEVMAGVRQALGGGKLDALTTFSLEAKTARNIGDRQMTADIELFLDLPGKYLRIDNMTAPMAMTMASGFNGDTVIRSGGSGGPGGPMIVMHGAPMAASGGSGGGGGVMTFTTRVAVEGAMAGAPAGGEMSPEQRAMVDASVIRAQRVELSRLMLGWFATAHPALKATYTYGGEAESPDGKAHIINVKADGGFEAQLFVDEATSMPLMVVYQGPEPRVITRGPGGAAAPHAASPPPPGGQAQITREQLQQLEAAPVKMAEYRVYFGDWKEVDGIQFPHMLQRAMAGTTTEEWTIDKVKMNPKIDAKKFQ